MKGASISVTHQKQNGHGQEHRRNCGARNRDLYLCKITSRPGVRTQSNERRTASWLRASGSLNFLEDAKSTYKDVRGLTDSKMSSSCPKTPRHREKHVASRSGRTTSRYHRTEHTWSDLVVFVTSRTINQNVPYGRAAASLRCLH